MSRKDDKAWKKLWGNAALDDKQLMSKLLLILYEYPQGLAGNLILSELFESAKGPPLNDRLYRILTRLEFDGLIQRLTGGAYGLNGKGFKVCSVSFKLLKLYPYEFWIWKQRFEIVITKYLPIIFSLFALLISYMSYNFIIHRK